MEINIKSLFDNSGSQKSFELIESLNIDEQKSQDLLGMDEVKVQGVCSSNGLDVDVNGTITTEMSVVCSRCSDEFKYPVNLDFEAHFSENIDIENGIYGIENSVIKLDDIVLEEIFLSLPYQFLCREDCRGLCPTCGINLNREQCDCNDKISEDNPFYKLKGLFES